MLIMQTIVELPEYTKRSDKILKKSESDSIIHYLAAHPAAGRIMQGTGITEDKNEYCI